MTRTWFTSDQHFNHVNIISYCNRPFANVEEMNAELIRRHNEVVKPEDTIFMLGDFSMSPHALPFVRELNGVKHLIAGNHDYCHPLHAKPGTVKSEHMTKRYLDAGFASIQTERIIEVNDIPVLMHHMPYIGDHTEGVRYANMRPKDDGLWLLHGHVHNAWKVSGRMINVGVDQHNYAPVSMEEIVDLIKCSKA